VSAAVGTAHLVAKGLPSRAAGLSADQIAERSWSLARGDLPLPVAALSRTAIEHNIATMAAWCRDRDVLLAPHGKTTMAPDLFRRQLDAGAWGITVSSARQAEVAAAAGAERIIVAHQVVDAVQLDQLAALARRGIDVMVFVDSAIGVQRLADRADGDGRLSALVEMGMADGRTGVRSETDLYALLERVASTDTLPVAGVSAFEGLVPAIRRTLPAAFGGLEPTTEAVRGFLDTVATAIAGARDRGLLNADSVVTAGGSASFDLVVDAMRGLAGPLVLRSGCYVTHDHGLYLYQSPLQAGNDPGLADEQALRPALEVWAHVVSRPEPAVAVVGLGRRDVGDDFGMPIPTARVAGSGGREPVGGWTVTQLWDQHGQLRADENATGLDVGDVLTFGISHPCTTFDKWRSLVEIDDDDRVVGIVETAF
jgi:D-serine dehydratase